MASHSQPEAALMELTSPDGYYSYLNIPKPESIDTAIDLDRVKKNYRKLSLKHHPDKPSGDADTFRVLNRAQKVLSDEKLRKQYHALGLDLDDDEEDAQHDASATDPAESSQAQKPSGMIQEIAGSVLTAVMQTGIRTAIMGVVSVFIVRYQLTFYLSLLFMGFVIVRIVQQMPKVPGGSLLDTLPPSIIIIGLSIMFHAAWGDTFAWSFQYWLGETLVIAMILYNSLDFLPLRNPFVLLGIFVFAFLAALWFRGNLWNYLITLGFTVLLALLIAIAFPMLELLFDAILQEKLRKVGERVRQQHKILKKYYEDQKRRDNAE